MVTGEARVRRGHPLGPEEGKRLGGPYRNGVDEHSVIKEISTSKRDVILKSSLQNCSGIVLISITTKNKRIKGSQEQIMKKGDMPS